MPTIYVAGFLFRKSNQEVALIQKKKPAWQLGCLNGIGGKVENGETAYQAMRREFAEEAGVLLQNWREVAVLTCDNGNARIHFFANLDGEDIVLQSLTDEKVEWVKVSQVVDSRILVELENGDLAPVLPNLRWLIPLALDPGMPHAEVVE
jgi:8-oxo-dGTP diphosphatase